MESTPTDSVKAESPKTDSKEEGIFFVNEIEEAENHPEVDNESFSMSSTDQNALTHTGSSGFGSSEGGVRLIKCSEGGEKYKSSVSLKKRQFIKSPQIDERSSDSVDSTSGKIIYPQRTCFQLNAESHYATSDHNSSGSSHNHSSKSGSHEARGKILLKKTSSYRISEDKSHRSHKHHHIKEKENGAFMGTEKSVNLGSSKSKKEDSSSKKRSNVIITCAPNYLKAEDAMTASTSVEFNSATNHKAHLDGDSKHRWFPPEEALRRFGSHLSDYEKSEILHYKKIWYFGLGAAKSARRKEPYNSGYDNKKGEYKTVVHDHIAYRYEVIRTLGKGAFGEVVSAFDHKKKRSVALKIIRNRPNLHEQARIEVNALKILEHHDPEGKNFALRIFDSFTFRNHPCIVCELIGANLYEVLKQGDFRGLPMKIIRSVAKCILKCLAVLSEESIIHCDIKPENILLVPGAKPYVKLIDFGSNCRESEQIYTYIQSRFYRAPEVILGMRYTTRIDMWSLGCLLAELHRGIPLFPGTSEANQLECIANLLEKPPEEMLAKSTNFDKMKDGELFTFKLATSKRKTFDEELGPVDPDFKDFIRRCLVWKPEDRMSVEEALKHPWIKHSSSNSKKGYVLHNCAVLSGSPVNFSGLYGTSPTHKKPDHHHSGVRFEWLQPLDPRICNPRYQKALI